MEFTIEHNRLRFGEFPQEKLKEIEGVEIVLNRISFWADLVTISLDESLKDPNEDMISAVFNLGMLAQMYISQRES